ncbi:SIS domain-containing protein [Plectosphaerella plurivora]|uniref:SIS domain-containing protein n=1 Tax=Plectosphaerella plurivora TaxID=936078 RepID=A0A9P8V3H0_9PEZI|nr:SIS domain-containing protein [Plectosphaerella plurivora]
MHPSYNTTTTSAQPRSRSRGPIPMTLNIRKATDSHSGPKSPLPKSPLSKYPMRPFASEGRTLASAATYEERLDGALHVLRTEAHALSVLSRLYASDHTCRDGFFRSIEAITRQRQHHNGKVVFVGVGKSGWIAQKLTATFTSLGLPAVFMHPTEALHGDLGIVGEHDTIIMVTFSGKTGELMLLLPHIHKTCPVIVMSSPMSVDACKLSELRPDIILLPAPIPEQESVSFGVSAPTTSTTMAIAVGDALAYVASKEMHSSVAAVFGKNHPGGAIGQTYAKGLH